MRMVKESAAHREFSKYLSKIGNHQITPENEYHLSLEAFRQQNQSSGVDTSKDLFKHETSTRIM